MKYIIRIVFCAICISSYSQESRVEKSIFGVQTGFAGVWLHNEARLTNSLALRTEIGLEYDVALGDHYDGAGFILQPVITLEPRYYYNLEKRSSQGKPIAKNSGNYLSLKSSYHPDWFVINLDEKVTKIADLSIIPTWGIKRALGKHLTYEAAVGYGFRVVFLKPYYFNGTAQSVDEVGQNRLQHTPDFSLRIGYTL
jgi:hypothetical protein